MLALPVAKNRPENNAFGLAGIIIRLVALEVNLDEVFVGHFLVEESNSYEFLFISIKNRYGILHSSLLTIKRFYSNHSIKKRMSVADRTVDIRSV